MAEDMAEFDGLITEEVVDTFRRDGVVLLR